MWTLGTPPLELVARSVIIYILFFGALRLFGKREVGQFTLFDLALVLLVANALQPAITGDDSSITGGAIILATIFAMNQGVALLRVRSSFVRGILDFKPTTIGRDGKWLTKEMERQGVDQADVDQALREHGIDSVEKMSLATLEDDGSISIVANDGSGNAATKRRRRRYRRPN